MPCREAGVFEEDRKNGVRTRGSVGVLSLTLLLHLDGGEGPVVTGVRRDGRWM